MNNRASNPWVKTTFATLEHLAKAYQPAVLATAFGPESMVMIDLIAKHKLEIQILSVDTGRLPEATYTLIQRTRRRYGLPIRLLHPDPTKIDGWVEAHGPNAFYDSADKRVSCCNIRKVIPLQRALAGKKAWITGLRRSQSASRHGVAKQYWDESYGLHKFNPMYDWTHDQVWTYIHENGVPYNELHDKGYPSIGCSPCTRATDSGEEERAGRWWWEHEAPKECGLHFDPQTGQLKRAQLINSPDSGDVPAAHATDACDNDNPVSSTCHIR